MKYISVILFNFLIKSIVQMSLPCYKIEDANHLQEYLITFKDSLVKVSQLKDCYAFVYELPDNSIVVLPQNKKQAGSKGFVFRDINCYEKNFSIAIKELKYENWLMSEKGNIFNIDKDINWILLQLKNNLDENITNISKESIYNCYKIINQIKDEKLRKQSIFSLSLLVGEVLRKETDSKWILIKYPDEYEYYWMPALLTKSNKIIMFFEMTMMKMQSETLSIDNLFNSGMFKYPEIPLESYKKSEYIIK